MRRSVSRIGLTGGIATGKSVCLDRFAALGAPTIDADAVARAVVVPGTAALAAIVARFGAGILSADGTLNRQALGRIVFADASARADLERIVHPAVYEHITGWFDSLSGGRPAIAAIPLLYETGAADRFDCVIVAACSESQQRDRLAARDGLTDEEVSARIQAQWPIDRKRRLADIVIDTSGSLAETQANVDRVWAGLGT